VINKFFSEEERQRRIDLINETILEVQDDIDEIHKSIQSYCHEMEMIPPRILENETDLVRKQLRLVDLKTQLENL